MATHPGIIRPRERWTSIGFARDAMGTYEALRKTDDPHVGIGEHPWSLGTAVFEAYRFAIGGVRSAHGHTARVRPHGGVRGTHQPYGHSPTEPGIGASNGPFPVSVHARAHL